MSKAMTVSNGRTFLEWALIDPDPEQPRKHFDKDKLAEFAQSLGAGPEDIHTDLLVRPHPKKDGRYLLVTGERRWRAAELRNFATVPVRVASAGEIASRALIQLTENMARENMTALEEAAGAQRVLEEQRAANPKFSVEDLGAKLGLKRAATYELLALNKVSQPVKRALQEGKLDASKAVMFARVPEDSHAKLLKEATATTQWEPEPMSVRKLREHIEKNFTRQLSAAPFKPGQVYEGHEVEPLATGGRVHKPVRIDTCTVCPFRSGNIEGMAGNPHICTKVSCYDLKVKFHGQAALLEAQKNGQRVVPPEQFRRHTSNFTTVDSKCYDDPKYRSYGQLAKLAKVAPAVTVDSNGAVVQVFADTELGGIKKGAGIKPQSYSSGGNASWKKAQAARTKKAAAMDKALTAAVPKILEKVIHGSSLDAKLWPFLAQAAYDAHNIDQHDFIAKRMGLSTKVNESRTALEKWFKAPRSTIEYLTFTVELLLLSNPTDGHYQSTKWNPKLLAVAKLAGVNVEKLMPEPKAKKAKAAPPKGGTPNKAAKKPAKVKGSKKK